MVLPNFVIIGAARSGTTSLYRYLAQHPDAFTSAIKETNFFAWAAEGPFDDPPPLLERMYPVRSAESYRALFADACGKPAIGEASPRYLHVPGVPEHLAAELQNPRVIAILREPGRRAYADYLVRRRKGSETRSFADVIEAEAQRMHEAPPPGSRPILHHGLYHLHLRRWLRVIPPDRLLVLLHDDLVADAADCFARLCRFLDIAELSTKDEMVKYGPAGLARSSVLDLAINGRFAKSARRVLPARLRRPASRLISWARRKNTRRPDLSPELRAKLNELYRDDVVALGNLIGRDITMWSPHLGNATEPRNVPRPAVGELHA